MIKNIFFTVFLFALTALAATKALQGDLWKSNDLTKTWTPPAISTGIIGVSDTAAVSNKSIDADSNTITNIDNNEIKAAAGINVSKLEALTANRALSTNSSGFVSATNVTFTELGYLSGVSAPIQTQIDNINVSVLSNGTISGTTTFATTAIGTLNSTLANPLIVSGTYATGGQFFLKSSGSSPVIENLNVSGTLTTNNLNIDGTVQNGTFNNPDFTGTVSSSAVITGGTVSGSTIIANDNVFTLQDNTTPTKKAQFELSGVSASTTRTLTVFDGDMVLGGTRSVSKTSNYTLVASTDDIIYADATSGAFTLTFPAASSHNRKVFIVKKTDSSFNAVTLSGTGMTTNYLMTVGEAAAFQSDGTSWNQIYRKTDVQWTTFTPTGTWSANTTYDGRWRRVGDSIEMQINVSVSGAPTAANLDVNIVNSSAWTIDTAKIFGSTNNRSLGEVNLTDVSPSTFYGGRLMYASTTSVRPLYYNVSGAVVGLNSAISSTTPMTFASGDYIYIRTFFIPITNFSP